MEKNLVLNRILAFIFDLFMVLAFSFIVCLPAIIIFVNNMVESTPSRLVALSISLFISLNLVVILFIFYFSIVPIFWNGQTLGKKFFFVRIVKSNYEQADFKALFLHALFHFLLLLATLGLSLIVDLITLMSSKKHLTFYDILANTKIVDAHI